MGEKPWQEALAEAAAAGYKLVEILMIPGFAHFTPDEVAPDTLWAELDKLGLTTIALHMGGHRWRERCLADRLAGLS